MPVLKDIQVDWISFVDRAAMRDPQNQSEPQRFLITKREGADAPHTTNGDSPMLSKTDIPSRSPISNALAAAKEALEPYVSDARIADLDRRLEAMSSAYVGDPRTGQGVTGEGEITKAADRLADSLVGVSKAQARIPADDLMQRAAVAKASRGAQLELLRQMSPQGADAWETARAA